MRDKDKKRRKDPIAYGGGQVKKEEQQEIEEKYKGKHRHWSEYGRDGEKEKW